MRTVVDRAQAPLVEQSSTSLPTAFADARVPRAIATPLRCARADWGRLAAAIVTVAASGCINLDSLGQLNDLSVSVGDDGGPGDMGANSDAHPPSTFAWTPATTGSPAGEAVAVAIDPVTTTNVYAAMAVGGVYRTTNSGSSWQKASTGLPAVGITALIIDPTAPQTIYAGTSSSGVYKSTNGASSWSAANLSIAGADIYSLALDSSAPQTIFAGYGTGLAKSIDGGAHWVGSQTGLPTTAIRGVAISHTQPSTMLATTYGNGVYQSVDGGAHWSALNTGLTDLHAYAVAIDPRSNTNFYVSTATGMFHSTNGTSWVPTAPAGLAAQWLTFDPSASSTVYAAAYGVGVYRTTNSGLSWTLLSNGQNSPLSLGIAVDPSASPTLYAATFGVPKSGNQGTTWVASGTGINNTTVEVLVADPQTSTYLFGGTPYLGEVMRSTNTVPSWSLINGGLSGAGAVTAIAIDPDTTTNVYVGTQLAGVVKTTSRGGSWTAMNSGLAAGAITAVAVDPNTPANVYAGVVSQGLFRSTDGALHWTAVATGLGSICAIVVVPGSGAVFAAGDGGFDGGAGGGLVRSSDGINYESGSGGFTTSRIEALVTDGIGNLYAGTAGGGVFHSSDGAASWVPINNGITNTDILALAVDPIAPAVLRGGRRLGRVPKPRRRSELDARQHRADQPQCAVAGRGHQRQRLCRHQRRWSVRRPMSIRVLCIVTALTALGGAGGCGFTTPANLACQDVATAHCNLLSRCSNGVTITRTYGSLANCIDRYVDSCSRGLQASNTGQTALGEERCAVAYQTESCTDSFALNSPAVCGPPGARSNGTVCVNSSQCASNFCANTKTTACGTCAAMPVPGDPCITSLCAPGQTCVSATQLCQTLVGLGSPCDNNTAPCGADLVCLTVSNVSTCVPAATQVGAACDNAITNCDAQRGLSCEGITANRTCQLTTLVSEGAPCGALPDGTYANCLNGGNCYTATGLAQSGQTGTCKSAAAEGAACDINLGPPCLFPARCVLVDASSAGTCAFGDPSVCN